LQKGDVQAGPKTISFGVAVGVNILDFYGFSSVR
jgi:hypothetical protein